MEKLFINGEIGWWADNYKNQIWNAPNDGLKVYIDSPGGSVTDGNSIAALLRMHAKNYNVEVETFGLGLVASIATMVLLAGTRVGMDKDALLMIHNPLAAYVSGESQDLLKIAATLDTIKAQLVERYVSKIEQSGKLVDGDRDKTKKVILKYMADEKWFTAIEALEIGLIDYVDEADEDKEEMQKRQEAMPEEGMQRAATIVNKFKITNNQTMEIKEDEKGLFAKFLAWFKNEVKDDEATAEIEEQTTEPTDKAETKTDETPDASETMQAEIEALKAKLEAAEAQQKALKSDLENSQKKLVNMQAKKADKPVENAPKQELTLAQKFENIAKKYQK